MDLATAALLIFLLCAFALLCWGVRSLGLPTPISVFVIVLMGLLLLYFMYQRLAPHLHGHA